MDVPEIPGGEAEMYASSIVRSACPLKEFQHDHLRLQFVRLAEKYHDRLLHHELLGRVVFSA